MIDFPELRNDITGRSEKLEQADHSPSIKAWQYSMVGHAEQCVDKYLELTGKSIEVLKPAATPNIDDHMFTKEDFSNKGEVADVAARIVLKALYLARTNRPDILWTVNALARKVTKWDASCDKRLLRLISYLHSTKDQSITCYVGDCIANCNVHLFVDASFAGDLEDSKSTTGAMVVLVGQNTWIPITWLCKKQGAVSHSSTEAEVIALETSLRMEGIPSVMLWDLVLQVLMSKT